MRYRGNKILSARQIVLPRCLMNGLSNLRTNERTVERGGRAVQKRNAFADSWVAKA